MAHDGVIAAYLRELRYSVATLADADELVAEAEDHLLEVAERLLANGRSRPEAEAEAVARFGSAALVARVCISESGRGVAVPTVRTRQAGLAALVAPMLLVAGQLGNFSIERGVMHGVAIAMLVAAFPALLFGLWGLRARHGGLGRLVPAAFVLALLSPILSLAAGWAAFVAFVVLLSLAVVVFAIELLRASVLPVVPLVLFAVGPICALCVATLAVGVTVAGKDGGDIPLVATLAPMGITGVGLAWLGWSLWRESAVDGASRRTGHHGLTRRRQTSTTTASL